MRIVVSALAVAGALAAQQGPSPRALAEMTVSIGEVRIGADEHGRSELCEKLAAIREGGFPVTPAAKGQALRVECEARPAKALVLRVTGETPDPKRALCEFGAAPAGLAYDRIDWVTLRLGGSSLTGDEMRNRLEPLGVRTYAALLFAFGFERIEARDEAKKTLVQAPLHQIDGFCAAGG